MEWCTRMICNYIICLSLQSRLKPLHQLNLNVLLTLDLGQHQINWRLMMTRLRLCTSDLDFTRMGIFLVPKLGTLWSNLLLVSKILVYTLTSTLRCLITLIMCVAWPLFTFGLLVNYASTLIVQQQSALFMHSLSSRLDTCNCLLYGLPETDIAKLQSVQNSAAHLVIGAKHSDHITPILDDLHWLPVRKRILFKLLLIVYKNLAPVYSVSQ